MVSNVILTISYGQLKLSHIISALNDTIDGPEHKPKLFFMYVKVGCVQRLGLMIKPEVFLLFYKENVDIFQKFTIISNETCDLYSFFT